MGTNYYLTKKGINCSECKRPHEVKHIGKDSAGWVFALHIYPEEMIDDIDQWVELWSKDEYIIIDEYKNIIDKDFLYNRIVNKISITNPLYATRSEEFLKTNCAKIDKNGLLRTDIDRAYLKYGSDCPCVAHGKGTYDLFVGEFS